MAATGTPTPNIGLRIPLGTDPASVDDINYNSNLIDTKLGAVGNDSVQDQIDDLNSKITNPTLYSENYNGANFVLYRIGNVVIASCIGSTYNAPSASSYLRDADNNILGRIPWGYQPICTVDVKDNLIGQRLQLSPDSNGNYRFNSTAAFSSAALRFTICWLTSDGFPS